MNQINKIQEEIMDYPTEISEDFFARKNEVGNKDISTEDLDILFTDLKDKVKEAFQQQEQLDKLLLEQKQTRSEILRLKNELGDLIKNI